MKIINIELTNVCPLHCPQCYCKNEGGKHIDLSKAKRAVDEAVSDGVTLVNLSGGETLCYPDLYELISYSSHTGVSVNIAISGWGFDCKTLDRLLAAGVNEISVSLNGSNERVNSYSREGFAYAIRALDVIRQSSYHNACINWVMQRNNADDFPNMVELAERYDIGKILIIVYKPDSNHHIDQFPTTAQIRYVSDCIRQYRGQVKLEIEACFSQLRALAYRSSWAGNLNIGPLKGCCAGRIAYSVNLDGDYSPCRHINYYESFPSLAEYLQGSEMIKRIHQADRCIGDTCAGCSYQKNCRPCLAIPFLTSGKIIYENRNCELYKD